MKLECAFAECAPKSGDKLAAEDTAEHFDGKEERAAGGDPAGVIWGEAAGGKHAVDMGMILQSLVPGMEHTEEADLGSNVPGTCPLPISARQEWNDRTHKIHLPERLVILGSSPLHSHRACFGV